MATTTPKTLDIIKASVKDLTSNDPVKKARAEEIKKRYQAGAFNDKLVAEGAKPVPIKKPTLDLSKSPVLNATMDLSKPSPFGYDALAPKKDSVVTETFKDIKDTGSALFDTAKDTVKGVKDIATDSEFNPEQKIAGVLGKIVGGASQAIGDVVTGAGKTVLSQDAEDALKGIAVMAGEKVSESEKAMELVKGVTEWYNGLDKDDKLVVDTAGGMASFMTDILGIGVAKKPVVEAIDATVDASKQVIKKGVDTTVQTAKEGGEAVMSKVDEIAQANKVKRLASQEAKVDEAVGRIIQGTPEDIAQAKRALSEIDTNGIETYSDLNTRIDDNITTLAKKVDAELSKDTQKYTNTTLGKYTKVGEKTVVQNPIDDALDGLENAYKLSGEAPNAERIAQLRARLKSDGLTLKEVNDIAREYGAEFKNRAFDKIGNPKQGFGAESFENTRKGMKDVLRERMPDDVTKELDKQMSDLYSTKVLTEKMEVKVNQLYQKVKERGVLEKIARGGADVVNALTFNTVSGFLSRFFPSQIGLKTMNSIDIEKELAKNLGQIEKLLNMKDGTEFDTAIKSLMTEVNKNLPTE